MCLSLDYEIIGNLSLQGRKKFNLSNPLESFHPNSQPEKIDNSTINFNTQQTKLDKSLKDL